VTLPGREIPLASVAYLAFVAVAVVGPGLALHKLLRIRVDPALVLPVGFGTAAGLYWLGAATGVPALLPVVSALLGLSLLAPPRRLQLAPGPGLRGAVLPWLAGVAFLAVTAYPFNRTLADGRFVADGLHPGDAAFHVGLTWELTHTYPPETPGLSGVPLGYHLGQPLLRAAATRWAGIHPYDALSRFDNTLGLLALVLALRTAAWVAGAGDRGVALAGFAPLATDLALFFAWGRGIEWWVSLFEASAGIASFVHANSVVPALAMALGVLAALARWEASGERGWLALAAGLGLATAFFKVFVAAQLSLGLGVAAVLAPRRIGGWLAVAPLALATIGLAAGGGGETMAVVLDPLTVVRDARTDLGYASLSGAGLALWTPVWLAAALGLRAAGVPAALRALRGGAPPVRALAVVALSGWPLGLLLRISPEETGLRVRPFNEALYFFEQSGLVLWVFAAVALGRLAAGPLRTWAAAGLALLLALPTTFQFAWRKSQVPSQELAADAVAATAAVAAVADPGAVVLQRPELQRFPPAPMVLAPLRVPYTRSIPFFSQVLARPDRRERFEKASSFFAAEDPREAVEIARALGASYVCYYGRDRPRFPIVGILEPLFEGERARAYRIPPQSSSSSTAILSERRNFLSRGVIFSSAGSGFSTRKSKRETSWRSRPVLLKPMVASSTREIS
jgi:hypothetical protein